MDPWFLHHLHPHACFFRSALVHMEQTFWSSLFLACPCHVYIFELLLPSSVRCHSSRYILCGALVGRLLSASAVVFCNVSYFFLDAVAPSSLSSMVFGCFFLPFFVSRNSLFLLHIYVYFDHDEQGDVGEDSSMVVTRQARLASAWSSWWWKSDGRTSCGFVARGRSFILELGVQPGC